MSGILVPCRTRSREDVGGRLAFGGLDGMARADRGSRQEASGPVGPAQVLRGIPLTCTCAQSS